MTNRKPFCFLLTLALLGSIFLILLPTTTAIAANNDLDFFSELVLAKPQEELCQELATHLQQGTNFTHLLHLDAFTIAFNTNSDIPVHGSYVGERGLRSFAHRLVSSMELSNTTVSVMGSNDVYGLCALNITTHIRSKQTNKSTWWKDDDDDDDGGDNKNHSRPIHVVIALKAMGEKYIAARFNFPSPSEYWWTAWIVNFDTQLAVRYLTMAMFKYGYRNKCLLAHFFHAGTAVEVDSYFGKKAFTGLTALPQLIDWMRNHVFGCQDHHHHHHHNHHHDHNGMSCSLAPEPNDNIPTDGSFDWSTFDYEAECKNYKFDYNHLALPTEIGMANAYLKNASDDVNNRDLNLDYDRYRPHNNHNGENGVRVVDTNENDSDTDHHDNNDNEDDQDMMMTLGDQPSPSDLDNLDVLLNHYIKPHEGSRDTNRRRDYADIATSLFNRRGDRDHHHDHHPPHPRRRRNPFCRMFPLPWPYLTLANPEYANNHTAVYEAVVPPFIKESWRNYICPFKLARLFTFAPAVRIKYEFNQNNNGFVPGCDHQKISKIGFTGLNSFGYIHGNGWKGDRRHTHHDPHTCPFSASPFEVSSSLDDGAAGQ